MTETCIVFCRCSAGIISAEKLKNIESGLQHAGADIFVLDDLCALTVEKSPVLRDIEKQYSRKIVIACYPRAVEKMLEQSGFSFTGMQVLNMRELSEYEIKNSLSGANTSPNGETERTILKSGLTMPAWYPVIDRSRCTSCGQCVRFCLFGVYRKGQNEPEVIQPLNCKNLCPACGRACPSSAIIFPRLNENTALAGAESGKITIDASAAQQGSMLSALQQRSRVRQSVLRSGILQQAEEERRKALEQFRKETIQNKNSEQE